MGIVRLLKPLVEKVPALAAYYRYRRDSAPLTMNVLHRDRLGFSFNGPAAMQDGTFEPDETLIFDKIIVKFDSFVNIGANTGYYVCKALHQGVDTIAFEPVQLNVNILLRNVEANKFAAQFQLFPIALSDQLGVLPLYGANTGASLIEGWAGQRDKTLVPISTFDRTASPLIEKRKCFTLIDIEGAELGCLKGCHTLLNSTEDNVFLIEISVDEHQPTGRTINPHFVETFEYMESFGYVAYRADREVRRIDIAEIKEIAKTGVDTLRTHNFLFFKSHVQPADLGL